MTSNAPRQTNMDCRHCSQKGNGVFCGLSRQELSELSQLKAANRYPRGQVIFHEGNAPLGAYCVYSGLVRLFKMDEEGRIQVVKMAGPGELLGEEAILGDRPYSLTAQALEDCSLCFIEKRALLKLLETKPVLALEVARKLGRDLIASREKLKNFTQKSAASRLAQALLELDSAYQAIGCSRPAGIKIARQALAEIIGASKETAIRLLGQFKRRGFTACQGQRIVVVRPESLKSLAGA